MESTRSQVLAPSELAPVNGKGATPFAQQTVVLTKQAYIELTWQANYWRAQYEQLLEREAALKPEVAALGGDRLREPNGRFTLCTDHSMPSSNAKRLVIIL